MAKSVHVYRCDNRHEPKEVVVELPFGQAPERRPDCAVCAQPMPKVWGKPQINYAIHWNWSQKNGGGDRDH